MHKLKTCDDLRSRLIRALRGEYEFTVLLLLSGAIKYIPPKQQKKRSYVEYKPRSIRESKRFQTLKLRLHDFVSWCMLYTYEGN